MRVIVFATDLRKVIAGPSPRPGVRCGRSGDREQLIAAGADARWVDSGVSDGSTFIVAEEGERIVGYSCYATHENVPHFSWLVIRLRPGLDVCSVGGFVTPESRGQRIRGDMRRFAAHYFVERGYQRMIGVVDATNTASLRSNASSGTAQVATLTRVRMGKLIVVWQGAALRHVRGESRPFVFVVPETAERPSGTIIAQ
jgi:L-amino acid N-acyltransferase YncA